MYITAVANSVMLYSRHDFYNIIFTIKHKLYIALGSAPTPIRNSGAQLPSALDNVVVQRRAAKTKPTVVVTKHLTQIRGVSGSNTRWDIGYPNCDVSRGLPQSLHSNSGQFFNSAK